MPLHQGQAWQFDEDAASAYERYLVPAFFTACADVLLDTVGLDPRFEVATLDVRFPSAEEFLRQEAASAPLAGFFVGIDNRVRQALVDDLSNGLRSYVDDQGIGLPCRLGSSRLLFLLDRRTRLTAPR